MNPLYMHACMHVCMYVCMYVCTYTSQVPKAEFKILLRYMEALKGNQRQLTVARAQRIVSEFQSEDSTVNNRMHKRALAVLKVLS